MAVVKLKKEKKGQGGAPPAPVASTGASKMKVGGAPVKRKTAKASGLVERDQQEKTGPERKKMRKAASDGGGPSLQEDGSCGVAGNKKKTLKNKVQKNAEPERPEDDEVHQDEESHDVADETEEIINSENRRRLVKAAPSAPSTGEDPDASDIPAAAAAAAAAAARWGAGKRWIVLLSFCPLLLLRRRSSSKKKEKHQQQSSCLLTADDHSNLIDAIASPGIAPDISGKKGINPVMPVVRRVQSHLVALSSSVASAQREPAGEGGPAGGPKEGPVRARVRECVAAEAARVAAAATDPNWVATACMRPDVVHQCLLSFLDSLLLKMLRHHHKQQKTHQRHWPLELLLHTLDGKLLRISPEFRVPRTFKVFKKVMEMALSSPTGRLESKSEQADDDMQQHTQQQPLIEVLQPPFWKYFEEDSWWVALSESRRAPPVSVRSFLSGLPETLRATATEAARRTTAAATAAPKNKQQNIPSVVFVISASPSVDSALVPQWLPPIATSIDEDSSTNNIDTQREQQRERNQRLLAVAPHSYRVPASLRCDRLLHELVRAAWRGPMGKSL